LHGRYLVLLHPVTSRLVCLGVSRDVRLVVCFPLLSHPLWPSMMLRWHPRRLGALYVFWARSHKLL
jgi:hypothetical protein